MTKINNNIEGDETKRAVSLGISLEGEDQAKLNEPYYYQTESRFYTAFQAKGPSGLAAALGVTVDSVYSARKNKHVPYGWYVRAFQLGISSDWLMSGEGAMLRGKTAASSADASNASTTSTEKAPAPIDPRLLHMVVAALEEHLARHGVAMSPAKKADWIVELYDTGWSAGNSAQDKVGRLLKLVS